MRKLLGCLAAVAVFTGCWQKSVEPFYTEKDLVPKPALAGGWKEADEVEKESGDVWTFVAQGEKRFVLKVAEDDETIEFDARWFRLGEQEFLDVASRKREVSEIPAHHLLRVSLKEDTLEMSVMSLEWMQKWLKGNPKSLSHIRINDPGEPDNEEKFEIVLTAKTAELQKFVQEHLKDEGFFEDPVELKRIAPKAAGK